MSTHLLSGQVQLPADDVHEQRDECAEDDGKSLQHAVECVQRVELDGVRGGGLLRCSSSGGGSSACACRCSLRSRLDRSLIGLEQQQRGLRQLGEDFERQRCGTRAARRRVLAARQQRHHAQQVAQRRVRSERMRALALHLHADRQPRISSDAQTSRATVSARLDNRLVVSSACTSAAHELRRATLHLSSLRFAVAVGLT